MINKNSKIYISGHNGMLGSGILKFLENKGFKKIFLKTRKELDLRDQKKVFRYIAKIKPEAVIICSAKVGGIKANDKFKAEFIYDNLSIQNNLIHGSFKASVKNLIFFGSSCIYPKNARQPIKESDLLTGRLELTNEPYAIAKIAGIKLCESYNFQYNTNNKNLINKHKSKTQKLSFQVNNNEVKNVYYCPQIFLLLMTIMILIILIFFQLF
jgi:GDP-L-fucose synthase